MGFILVFCITALSIHPLTSIKMHEKLINQDGFALTCCYQVPDSCCDAVTKENSESGDCDTEHKCTEMCDCVALGLVTFKMAGSGGFELPAVVLEETAAIEFPYHFSMHYSIWHPPRV